jgi:hypothetical protein
MGILGQVCQTTDDECGLSETMQHPRDTAAARKLSWEQRKLMGLVCGEGGWGREPSGQDGMVEPVVLEG